MTEARWGWPSGARGATRPTTVGPDFTRNWYELAGRTWAARVEHAAKLQRKLWDGLSKRVPLVKLNGPPPGPERLPNNLHLSFEFVEGEGLLLMLDAQGIAAAMP